MPTTTLSVSGSNPESHATISYTDDGSGPPVLLLHAALHDRTDYASVHDALGRGRRVIALDWPGHGESPVLDEPLGAVQFGDLAVEFVDRLDLRNVVVVGNSVGGYAACRLALERPDRIAGVVLVNTGGFTAHTAFIRAFCAVMGKPAVIRAVAPLSVPAYMHARTPAERAMVRRVVARARTADGSRTAAALWRSFTDPGHDLRQRADAITAPVLITWGTKDLTAPVKWGEAVHSAIPGSTFVGLGTGHVVFAGEPNAWLDAVLPFVESAHRARCDVETQT
ncbi:alpha/beta fold hydrolase [Mycobacterium sp. AZCC_0083]|uniref:alpha/beta fold hydrolase n=1 Tax=Mycobacterium sp. AZCC_0083 TaxID=2735882 RepID=UPI00160F16DF|nr:alpha/beta hydrolase [Mycobacterium sp. AZCC_0083]MBB5160972.1 pimeloyl-ACP methyl ester carboxylesterase [Mycobacterium sp. AZCC_0083]